MIENENDGTAEWNVFDTGDLNAPKVNSQRQLQQRANHPTNHIWLFSDPRLSAFICGSTDRFDAIILMLSQLIQKIHLLEEDP